MTSFRIQNALPRPTGPRPLRVALAEAPLDPEDGADAPFKVVCQWEDNPPTTDSRLIRVQRPRRHSVTWGAPGLGW